MTKMGGNGGFFARRRIFFGEFDKTGFFWFIMFGMFAGMFDICHLSAHGARRTAHGARRTAETFGKTAFAVIALIGGFCALTFADRTSAQ
ncbi:MAG: hypothetical protein ACR2P4_06530, partial [Gammaproteobacteria bacterium]